MGASWSAFHCNRLQVLADYGGQGADCGRHGMITGRSACMLVNPIQELPIPQRRRLDKRIDAGDKGQHAVRNEHMHMMLSPEKMQLFAFRVRQAQGLRGRRDDSGRRREEKGALPGQRARRNSKVEHPRAQRRPIAYRKVSKQGRPCMKRLKGGQCLPAGRRGRAWSSSVCRVRGCGGSLAGAHTPHGRRRELWARRGGGTWHGRMQGTEGPGSLAPRLAVAGSAGHMPPPSGRPAPANSSRWCGNNRMHGPVLHSERLVWSEPSKGRGLQQ
jgi:hypothetical protein